MELKDNMSKTEHLTTSWNTDTLINFMNMKIIMKTIKELKYLISILRQHGSSQKDIEMRIEEGGG